jgi:hypothetical protein
VHFCMILTEKKEKKKGKEEKGVFGRCCFN